MFRKLTARGESWEEREKGGGGREAAGISFHGNHHLAHSNKLPALLKQREKGGVDVAVAFKLKMKLQRPRKLNNEQYAIWLISEDLLCAAPSLTPPTFSPATLPHTLYNSTLLPRFHKALYCPLENPRASKCSHAPPGRSVPEQRSMSVRTPPLPPSLPFSFSFR